MQGKYSAGQCNLRDEGVPIVQPTAAIDVSPRGPSLGRNRDFGLLLAGQFVSRLGDRLALVAFPWLVYSTTGSALSTGIVLALFTLPYVLFGALAGAVIDRSRKRTLMIAADVLRAGLVACVPFVAGHSLAAVYALTFLTACVTVFFDPCLLAFVPEVVPEEKLLRANSLLSTGENLTEIVGYAVAGLIVASFSLRGSFLLDAATFVVSALCLLGMRARGRTAAARAGGRPRALLRTLATDIREGFRFLAGHAGLKANTILTLVCVGGVGAAYPLSFLLAMRTFGGTRAFGFMEAAIGAGYLAGSLTLVVMARRVRKGLVMTIALVVMGSGYAVVGLLDSLPAVLVLFAALGAADAVLMIAVDTYLQQTIPAPLRGRVLGLRFTLTQGVYALGVLSAGALAMVAGVGTLFAAFGAIVLAAGVGGLLTRTVRDV